MRPKLTFRPDSARIMKQLAVSQWVKRSKLANRRIVFPEKPLLDANPAAHHQENRQRGQHPENGDAANDRQFAALEIAPVAPGGLDQAGGHLIGNGYPPGDLVTLLQRIQELVFLDGLGGRLEGKLRRRGMCEGKQQRDGGANGPEIRKRAWHRSMTFPFLVT